MLGELREPAVKKTKGHPYFTPELAYILASCEERIPLVNLGLEVSQICFCVNALRGGGVLAAFKNVNTFRSICKCYEYALLIIPYYN